MKNKRINFEELSSNFLAIIVFCFFIIMFAIVLISVGLLQLTGEKNGVNLSTYKLGQYETTSYLPANRGTIYDIDGNILAVDIEEYDMYAILDESHLVFNPETERYDKPDYVEDAADTASKIVPILNVENEDEIIAQFTETLSKEDVYQVEFGEYGKGLSLQQKKEIEALELPGIEFNTKSIRYYPYGDFASYIIGYAKENDILDEDGNITGDTEIVGELGIEKGMNGYLEGVEGVETKYTDGNGVEIQGLSNIPASQTIKPQDGTDVYLTIDTEIQSIVEHEMKNALEEIDGLTYDFAFTIVMDAHDGSIYAAYKSPSFDPNLRDIEDYTNPYTEFCYEPGSTMKTMTIAAAYDAGLWNDTTRYSTGARSKSDWGGTVISDWVTSGWGDLTWSEGYYMSSNTMMTRIQETIGNDLWMEYLTGENGFRFGTPVETEFFSTNACNFDPVYPIEYAASSFGQAVTVTPLQMLRAYTAITNSGVMVTPHIVSQVLDPDTGETIYEDEELREQDVQVLKEETSKFALEQMYNVINYEFASSWIEPSASSYAGSYYPLGTKTGTAQYVNPNTSTYVAGKYLYSTMNVAPIDDPDIIIYTAIKNPSNPLAKSSAMPKYVKAISDQTISYLNFESDVEYTEPTNMYTVANYVGVDTSEITDENVVVLGEGNVVSQYPKEGQKINSRTYVFANFNYTDFDFTGKSLEETTAICQTQEITCKFEGSGITVESYNVDDDNVYTFNLV